MEARKSPVLFSLAAGGVVYHFRSYMRDIAEEGRLLQKPHNHFFTEFHYIFAGEEHIFLPEQGREEILRAGEFGIIPAGCYHSPFNDAPVTRFCFHLEPEYPADVSAVEAERQYHIHCLLQNIRTFTRGQSRFLSEQMAHYRAFSGKPFAKEQQGALLLSVLFELLGQMGESAAVAPAEKYSTADLVDLRQKWLMEEYFTDEFAGGEGIEGLAKRLYLSPRHTRTLVKQYFGADYKDIILKQRMELARILLTVGDCTPAEAAARTGYRSYSGFYLAYRRYWGTSPGET